MLPSFRLSLGFTSPHLLVSGRESLRRQGGAANPASAFGAIRYDHDSALSSYSLIALMAPTTARPPGTTRLQGVDDQSRREPTRGGPKGVALPLPNRRGSGAVTDYILRACPFIDEAGRHPVLELTPPSFRNDARPRNCSEPVKHSQPLIGRLAAHAKFLCELGHAESATEEKCCSDRLAKPTFASKQIGAMRG